MRRFYPDQHISLGTVGEPGADFDADRHCCSPRQAAWPAGSDRVRRQELWGWADNHCAGSGEWQCEFQRWSARNPAQSTRGSTQGNIQDNGRASSFHRGGLKPTLQKRCRGDRHFTKASGSCGDTDASGRRALLPVDTSPSYRNDDFAWRSSAALIPGPYSFSKKPSFTRRSTVALSMTVRKSNFFSCAADCASTGCSIM